MEQKPPNLALVLSGSVAEAARGDVEGCEEVDSGIFPIGGEA